MTKKPAVAISGAHGFIGSTLANSFKADGYDVFALARDFDYEERKKELEKISPDYILHLAAYGNHSTQQDEDEMFAANVIKTYLLLKASLNVPYKMFVNFGSNSEYGNQGRFCDEERTPWAKDFYGCTKVCGTYLARAFAWKYKKPILTVRPFSVYGPGEADHRFIPTLIRSIETGESMPLVKEPVHDWIYIEDFVDALGALMAHPDKFSGRLANIGTGSYYTNLQVVKSLEKLTGKLLKYTEMEKRPNDKLAHGAICGSLDTLDWTPKFTFAEGLKKTYYYYKNRL